MEAFGSSPPPDSGFAFLSHSRLDSEFVCQVANYLKRHIHVWHYTKYPSGADDNFVMAYTRKINSAAAHIIFVGEDFSDKQHLLGEAQLISYLHAKRPEGNKVPVISVSLRRHIGATEDFPKEFPLNLEPLGFVACFPDPGSPLGPAACAKKIVELLGITWRADGLPSRSNLFSYEKDIISHFERQYKLEDLREELCEHPQYREADAAQLAMLAGGCPLNWPAVQRLAGDSDDRLRPNHLDQNEIGFWRNGFVAAAALRGYRTGKYQFDFPEAGPRAKLLFPTAQTSVLRVGVLVSGGIAPGINAVIDGIVQRHQKYADGHHTLEVRGYLYGLHGLKETDPAYRRLFATEAERNRCNNPGFNPIVSSAHVSEGGASIGTYRWDELLDMEDRSAGLAKLARSLEAIDILYVIGGDGSMKAAHALWNTVSNNPENLRRPFSVVGVPKTMDNDILWMWQSFGFLSAVEEARRTIQQLYTEVTSNPRLCVLQLFGSDSGFVVSHAVLASATGMVDLAMIPEVPFSILGIAKYLKSRIRGEQRRIPGGLVVMAETAIPVDAACYLNGRDEGLLDGLPDSDQQALKKIKLLVLSREEKMAIDDYDERIRLGNSIEGQTSDHLRRAGLKIVTHGLEELLKNEDWLPAQHDHTDWKALRTVTNEPRHLLRSLPPSTTDIIMAQRLGTLAVDNAMAGYTDCMVSQWLTEFVLVPLELVMLGRKRIPPHGIFWKSVLSKTGQKANLIAPWPTPEYVDQRRSPRSNWLDDEWNKWNSKMTPKGSG